MRFDIVSCVLLAGNAAAGVLKNQVYFSDDNGLESQSGFGDSAVQPQADFEGLEDFTVGNFSVLSLHKKLVEINSISNHEADVSKFLKRYLESLGLTVEVQEIKDDFEKRYNVYAYAGSTRDTKVVLTSHIDTVPPYLQYYIDGTRIYGRGSSDAKASVATQIAAFLSLQDSGAIKEGDVSLLYVVGEEIGGGGMGLAHELGVNWDVGIFGEPTELKLGVGHKGIYSFELTAHGKASHSGYPQLGVSASEILIPALNELINAQLPVSDLLGPSTLNIGRFEGGLAANVIPASAHATVSIRVATGKDTIVEKVHEIVKKYDNLTIHDNVAVDAVYLDYKVPGFDSIILAYSTDIPRLKVPLEKRYLYGPGSILVAHSDHEYVENADLLNAIDGYIKLVKHSI